MKARLLALLLLIASSASSALDTLPVAWRAVKAEQTVILLPQEPAYTPPEARADRFQTLRRLVAGARMVLLDLEGAQGLVADVRCPDDVAGSLEQATAIVPEAGAWADALGLPPDIRKSFFGHWGDHWIEGYGIGHFTEFAMLVRGLSPQELDESRGPPSPTDRLFEEGRRSKPGWTVRSSRIGSASASAWCAVPVQMRVELLGSTYALARERLEQLTSPRSSVRVAYRELGLLIDQRDFVRHLRCALQTTRCRMADRAAQTQHDLRQGISVPRAVGQVAWWSAQTARRIEALAASGKTIARVWPEMLPDYTHPTAEVTGLLSLLRERGYAVEPVW